MSGSLDAFESLHGKSSKISTHKTMEWADGQEQSAIDVGTYSALSDYVYPALHSETPVSAFAAAIDQITENEPKMLTHIGIILKRVWLNFPFTYQEMDEEIRFAMCDYLLRHRECRDHLARFFAQEISATYQPPKDQKRNGTSLALGLHQIKEMGGSFLKDNIGIIIWYAMTDTRKPLYALRMLMDHLHDSRRTTICGHPDECRGSSAGTGIILDCPECGPYLPADQQAHIVRTYTTAARNSNWDAMKMFHKNTICAPIIADYLKAVSLEPAQPAQPKL